MIGRAGLESGRFDALATPLSAFSRGRNLGFLGSDGETPMIEPEPDHCRICAAPLARPATGRPPRYCSTTCRRAAEYAIKRINRHLERLEYQRDQQRRYAVARGMPARLRRQAEEEIRILEADIDRYGAELAALL